MQSTNKRRALVIAAIIVAALTHISERTAPPLFEKRVCRKVGIFCDRPLCMEGFTNRNQKPHH